MRRSLSIVIILSVVALLSGCIISTSPKDNPVVLLPGQAKTFTINVFPQPAKYAWYVGGNVVPGETGNALIYTLNEVLPSDFTIEVRATHLIGTDKYTWNIQYVGTNRPPEADAGPDQSTSFVGAKVTLDGSGSTDPENNIISYYWEQTDGPTVTLSDPNAANPHFLANVPLGSILTFKLSVTDAGSLSDTDTCIVSIGTAIWNKTFGGLDDERADSVQQTSDGGYILSGFTRSYGDGSADALLIKTDAIGNKQWEKTFGGAVGHDDEAWSVQQTKDDGYILAGNIRPYNSSATFAWLIKTDVHGNKVWDKTFDCLGPDWGASWAYAVQQTSDSGYILTGTTNYNAWLIKTYANGIKEWDKTFDGLGEDAALSVKQTSDGGYIIAGGMKGWVHGQPPSFSDAWLIKTDADGNTVWDKTFGGAGDDGACSVQQTSDGGYILAGYTRSFGAGSIDAWLIKTDANGNAPATPSP